MNVVAIGTWSIFSGWPWRGDRSSKMKFYTFLSWSQCIKSSAGFNFYIFCQDHGVVNVVSAGIKIYFLSSSRCSRQIRLMLNDVIA